MNLRCHYETANNNVRGFGYVNYESNGLSQAIITEIPMDEFNQNITKKHLKFNPSNGKLRVKTKEEEDEQKIIK